MRTGPTSEKLKSLIDGLKQKYYADSTPFWIRLATDLEKPTRQRRIVNLSNISRNSKAGETIVVPGKVLADGELSHNITIYAWQFSASALEKIAKSKSKAHPIDELMTQEIKGKKVRILG